MSKEIAVRYIRPKQILTLDDIEWGELKRGIYVCTSTTHPSPLQEGDILYEIDTHRLLFVDDTLIPQPYGTVSWFEELITLTDSDITNRYVTLTTRPTIDSVLLSVCGLIQRRNIDYIVYDNRLIWAGYQLESELDVNDELYIRYIPS